MDTGLIGTLAPKLIPLYANIALGFLAGKLLNVQRESVASLVFYLIVPVVVFTGVSRAAFSPSLLVVPLIVFAVSSALAFIAFNVCRKIWDDKTPNLLSFAAGTANTGYFGIPVATILFPSETVAIYIVAMMGTILFEYTIGYYITARTAFTPKQSLLKVVKLPSIYAFMLGMAVSWSGEKLPAPIEEFGLNLKAAYSVLGMMIIGIGLSAMRKIEVDFKYLTFALVVKYMCWPLLMLLMVFLDASTLQILSHDMKNALFLLSIMPLAANTVIFATLFDSSPEKAAFAVLISTLLAIFVIPLGAEYLFGL